MPHLKKLFGVENILIKIYNVSLTRSIILKKNEHKEFNLKTKDGIKLALNHYKSDKDEVLIIANGWTMSKDSKFIKKISQGFFQAFDVISFDFRGHGKSSGIYTFTSKEVEDLKSVVAYSNRHYKKVFLIGFSLGGAISIIHCAQSENIDKLITISAPHSFKRIRNFMWIKDFIENPFKKYEFEKWIQVRANPLINVKINPIDVVDKIKAPTLFIAGESDFITDPNDTKSLFIKAKCEKQFELFENCNHAEDIIYQDRQKLLTVCTKWFLK